MSSSPRRPPRRRPQNKVPDENSIAVLIERMANLRAIVESLAEGNRNTNNKIDAIAESLRVHFVTREEFNESNKRWVSQDRYIWIERAVIAVIALVGLGVFGAMVSSVLVHTK
jgi:hypothetical protein